MTASLIKVFDFDKWQEIFYTIQRHKLRTMLTAFGVFWGIFMLVLLLGAGKGIENGVNSNFGQIATNSFFMWGRSTSLPYKGLNPGRWISFSNEDLDALRENIPEARQIAQFTFLGESEVSTGSKRGDFDVSGHSPAVQYLRPFTIEGRFLNMKDVEERRKVAVIGRQVKQILFGQEDPIGRYVNIRGIFFLVIGIYDLTGMGVDDEEREEVYIPYTALQQAFNRGRSIGWFGVVVDPDIPVAAVEEETKEFLKKRLRIAPEDDRAIGSWNTGKEFQQLQALFRGIRIFIWLVGAGTIVAGIVGVSNIMLIIVKERTREIGLRKALGATPFSIVSLILQETVVLTSISGYMGLVAGVGILEGVSYAMDTFQLQGEFFSNPEVDFPIAVAATTVLIVAGTLAGFIPAQSAVNINPIEALRSE